MPRAEKAPQQIRTYGLPLFPPAQHNQLNYERAAFRLKWPIEKGGLPRFQHFKNICKILWPWLEWNPWLEEECEVFCSNQWTGVAGCAGSCKTTGAVIYGVAWWLCGIHDSAMVLTSTTKGDIRKKAWSWVQKLYTSIPGARVGNMVDSRTTWQGVKGDDKHCVCAIAVREGSVQKAVARIQGFHPSRLLVIVDEATDTPEAIFESFPNLISTPWDFQVITLGNPNSKFDPFGKFCEPAGGWNSINVEMDQWETIPQLNGKRGTVIHFDAEKSPNILAGEIKWRYLPQGRRVEAVKKKLGENSPQFFKFWRGFWCPEGIVQTVLTESLLSKYGAAGSLSKHVFSGGRNFKVAFCDPAFGGGDRPVLKFATCGELPNGSLGIQLGRTQLLAINAQSSEPVHYQLAAQIKAHCQEEGVAPRHFGLDTTGEGGGLGDILMREWSAEIHRVEFGGKPSEYAVSNEDNRPCSEVYQNKVAELWYSVRELVVSDQLKGIDPEEARELTSRLWRLRGKKIEVEPKSTRKLTGDGTEESNWGFKERFGRSCDLGDAVSGICHVAKIHGAVTRTIGRTASAGRDWLKAAQKHDEVYAEEVAPESRFDAMPQREDLFAMEDV